MWLFFVVLFYQASQFHLYDSTNHVGILAVSNETLWLKMDKEPVETFEITKKAEESSTKVFYIKNEKARGLVIIGTDEILIALFVDKKYQYDRRFFTKKQ